MNRYKLENGPDGTTWVSLQPLAQDVSDNLDKLKNIVYDGEDKRELDMRILGLEAILSFIGALITEKKLELLRREHEEKQTTLKSIH